jgi:predicted molibdopterin-dependent oxidoreductase YjgC
MNSIKLWINDQEVEATANQTVLEACDSEGIRIPRLCAHPSLKPSGSCRLCAVEIDDHRGLPAACSTPVENGMSVRTDSAKVLDFRREMLRLILQEHPRECLGCARNGTCELQRLVELVGIDFPYGPPDAVRAATLPGGSYFERDPRLCVRCGRCVRVCHEVRGAGVLVFRESHGKQEVGTAFGRSLQDASCQFCGACVDVCPVAALREPLAAYAGEPREAISKTCEGLTRIVMDLYRKELPRSWQKSLCPLCSAHCQMSFEMTGSGRIVQARPAPGVTSNRGQACVQGRFLLKEHLQSMDRLRKPLVLENGRYRETDWSSALEELARRMSDYGPWETAVLTDARLTNEELFLLQKFARTVLRSNLVGCITPPGYSAIEETLAKSPAPADLRGRINDLSLAGVAFAIGVNPPATHPIGGTHLRQASLNGTRVIAANPCSVGIGRFADVSLSYAPGTEAALLSGLIHLVLREGRADPSIESTQPQYLKALRQDLAAFDPESVAAVTGIHAEKLVETACLFGGGKPVSILYGPGLLASPGCREAAQAMIVLLYITGSVGKAGGGMIPLYGDSNLQGASALDMTSPLFELSPGSRRLGADGSGGVGEMLTSGQIKALYVAMESLDSSSFESLRPYVEKLELVVLHDVIPPAPQGNGEGVFMPHLVLPMASALEKGGTFTGADGRPLQIPRLGSSVGEGRSALWVIQELARKMKAAGFSSESEETFLEEIRKQMSERTVLVKKPQRAVSGCCCCSTPVKQKAANCGNAPPEWKPMGLETVQQTTDPSRSFRAVAKEALEPHFLGPLLAREAVSVFYPDAEIEMSPADVFQMGLQPGDSVRVSSQEKVWEGRLGLNPIVPEGFVVMPALRLTSSEKSGTPKSSLAVSVEKTGEPVTG